MEERWTEKGKFSASLKTSHGSFLTVLQVSATSSHLLPFLTVASNLTAKVSDASCAKGSSPSLLLPLAPLLFKQF